MDRMIPNSRQIALFVPILLLTLAGSNSDAQGVPAEVRARILSSGRVGPGVVAELERSERSKVIIAYTGASPRPGLSAGQFRVRHDLSRLGVLSGDITAPGLLRVLEHQGVLRIDPDVGGSGNLAQALPLMNIDDVKGTGLSGAGVTVAVLDSGYDSDHPDLSDDLVGEACFCSGGGGCCPGGVSSSTAAGSAEDDNGHGTNVTGIITSRGLVAQAGGAPDAEIVAIKVLDSNNSFSTTSDVVAGLDWIINNRPDVDIVNMSLGTSVLFAGDCDNLTAYTIAFATAINTLRASGVTTFVSTGNDGSGVGMRAPACIANAISVGAVWDSNVGSRTILGCTDATTAADQVTCFSNSNTWTDLFAAGAPMTSSGRGGGTSTYYGTSQASPAAAACAALLLESDPSLTPAQIEAALESSPTLVTDATNGLSFPRVDCLNALQSLVPTATPTSTPTHTPTFTPDPAATPSYTPVPLGSFVGYVVRAPKRDASGVTIPNNVFPSNWVITLNDTGLSDTDADDPENFRALRAATLLNPVGGGGGEYLDYRLRPGPESTAPAVGKFARPAKHIKRLWELSNEFGTVNVISRKALGLFVPVSIDPSGAPAAPADATHFLCYKVMPSRDVTAQTPDNGSGVGRFRKDLQAYAIDGFDDCALLRDGVTPSFEGTGVEGHCLFDLKKPAELCNPADKTAVVPPRQTSATIDGSTATEPRSLLCYRIRLASRFRDPTAAAQAGALVDDPISPSQARHVRRRIRDANQLYSTPGNLFPNPVQLETAKQSVLCVPTDVLGVTPES